MHKHAIHAHSDIRKTAKSAGLNFDSWQNLKTRSQYAAHFEFFYIDLVTPFLPSLDPDWIDYKCDHWMNFV